MTPQDARRAYTVPQLAELLEVDPNTIRRHCRSGRLAAERVPVDRAKPQRRHGGRRAYVWRIDPASARRFLATYVWHEGSGVRR